MTSRTAMAGRLNSSGRHSTFSRGATDGVAMARATLVIGRPSPPRVAGRLILRQAQDEVHSVGRCHDKRVLMLSLSKHEGWQCNHSHHYRDDRADGQGPKPPPPPPSPPACTAPASWWGARPAPCMCPPGGAGRVPCKGDTSAPALPRFSPPTPPP